MFKVEHKNEIAKHEDRMRVCVSDIEALEARLKNRESRGEDLDRIRDMELELIEKDRIVQKTKEEMLYFKREMLNREENYNGKFGSAPNVGVMQVLKSKPTAAPGKTKK